MTELSLAPLVGLLTPTHSTVHSPPGTHSDHVTKNSENKKMLLEFGG